MARIITIQYLRKQNKIFRVNVYSHEQFLYSASVLHQSLEQIEQRVSDLTKEYETDTIYTDL